MMTGVRHLTEQQTLAALRRGAPVEQMLTATLASGTISWLRASPSATCFALRLHQDLDDGSDDFFDVYEFRSVDEDDYLGEGCLVGEYPDAATVLEAATRIGARIDRWVNEGMIQDEYADLRTRDSAHHSGPSRP
jgi:hypothetical protein